MTFDNAPARQPLSTDDAATGDAVSTERVAVLMSRFPSVTETFILREMIELERQGQPVRLVSMLKENPAVVHDAARPWIARAFYTPWISPAIVASNVRTLLKKPLKYVSLLARLVVGSIGSADVFTKSIALFPKSVHIAERLEAEGVRHIHAHFATHPATIALIVSELSNVTFSITVHAHDIFIDHHLLRWKVAKARFIRSISRFNKDYLERLYPRESEGKIDVVHVGIEPRWYEDAASEIVPQNNPPLLLCVAAHKPYKGLPTLIEAAALLHDRGVDFRCDVIGDGPMRGELEAQIRARRLEGIVNLVGPRPQEVVTRLMAESTLFVLPSTIAADGQMEGIPVALMEAMASGRAVISTATSGIPELIEDGVNGRLVPHDDPKALAHAVEELLRNPQRAAAMGQAGQEKVRREFELTDCVRGLARLLEQERRSRA